MKKILLLMFLSFSSFSFSQNLVPNPSFEDTVACPTTYGQIDKAVAWSSYNPSPDYFHCCSGNPNNFGFGFQYAHTGKAHGGGVQFNGWSSNNREILGSQLIEPLIIGQNYYISFWVNLGDWSSCAINNVGILFIKDLYYPITPKNISHLYSSQIISDTVNWIKISGSFIPDSSYKYILIGNFFDDENTDTMLHSGLVCNSYYFIDDVCVSIDSLICEAFDSSSNCGNLNILDNAINKQPFIINLNPSIDRISIEMHLSDGELTIFNSIGAIVENQKLRKGNNYFDFFSFTSGLYFFQIKTQNKFFYKKVIITN